eukprot:TRINITY_DN45184_c0_g1_i1.p1 TRINITY_DN45184_c0_g1~~TRINITY_DN45184_c0_g1_i1.p1  ORF type:complete len:445 (-),score=76.04 TRINITY_DN45184_c0_g1_i1:15-1349(-)
MAPKRRAARKSGKKSKTGRKKTKTSGKSKKANASGGSTRTKAKSAYSLFCADRRANILRDHGVNDGPVNLGEASQLLALAWRELPADGRQLYEEYAQLERFRVELDLLKACSMDIVPKIANIVREVVKALGRLTHNPHSSSITSTIVASTTAALEGLDRRLKPYIRAALGERLGAQSASSAVGGKLRQIVGVSSTDRLVALLRRWQSEQLSALSTTTAAVVRSRTKTVEAPKTGPLDGDTRKKVIGLLMRTFARGIGQAMFARCKQIEEELFTFVGKDPKEYRRRARSLAFNLNVPDGALRRRLLDGALQPKELVRLDCEDLASDLLRAERIQERERYFRTEIHDMAGPPKRWQGLPSGRRAERTGGDLSPQRDDETVSAPNIAEGRPEVEGLRETDVCSEEGPSSSSNEGSSSESGDSSANESTKSSSESGSVADDGVTILDS